MGSPAVAPPSGATSYDADGNPIGGMSTAPSAPVSYDGEGNPIGVTPNSKIERAGHTKDLPSHTMFNEMTRPSNLLPAAGAMAAGYAAAPLTEGLSIPVAVVIDALAQGGAAGVTKLIGNTLEKSGTGWGPHTSPTKQVPTLDEVTKGAGTTALSTAATTALFGTAGAALKAVLPKPPLPPPSATTEIIPNPTTVESAVAASRGAARAGLSTAAAEADLAQGATALDEIKNAQGALLQPGKAGEAVSASTRAAEKIAYDISSSGYEPLLDKVPALDMTPFAEDLIANKGMLPKNSAIRDRIAAYEANLQAAMEGADESASAVPGGKFTPGSAAFKKEWEIKSKEAGHKFVDELRAKFGDAGVDGVETVVDDPTKGNYWFIQRHDGKVVGGGRALAGQRWMVAGGKALDSPRSASEIYEAMDNVGTKPSDLLSPYGKAAQIKGSPTEMETIREQALADAFSSVPAREVQEAKKAFGAAGHKAGPPMPGRDARQLSDDLGQALKESVKGTDLEGSWEAADSFHKKMVADIFQRGAGKTVQAAARNANPEQVIIGKLTGREAAEKIKQMRTVFDYAKEWGTPEQQTAAKQAQEAFTRGVLEERIFKDGPAKLGENIDKWGQGPLKELVGEETAADLTKLGKAYTDQAEHVAGLQKTASAADATAAARTKAAAKPDTVKVTPPPPAVPKAPPTYTDFFLKHVVPVATGGYLGGKGGASAVLVAKALSWAAVNKPGALKLLGNVANVGGPGAIVNIVQSYMDSQSDSKSPQGLEPPPEVPQ